MAKQTDPIARTEADLYKLFDMVWSKYYNEVKSGQVEKKMTESELFVLNNGPAWLQDLGFSRSLIEEEE